MGNKVDGKVKLFPPNTLSPALLKDGSSLYRTPTMYAEDQCALYVGDNMVRYFTNKTMPREVKVKLGMVRGYEGPVTLYEKLQVSMSPLVVYENTYPKEFEEIGWRITDTLYCLSLTYALLVKLRSINDSEA
jgi:hypothetical protein